MQSDKPDESGQYYRPNQDCVDDEIPPLPDEKVPLLEDSSDDSEDRIIIDRLEKEKKALQDNIQILSAIVKHNDNVLDTLRNTPFDWIPKIRNNAPESRPVCFVSLVPRDVKELLVLGGRTPFKAYDPDTGVEIRPKLFGEHPEHALYRNDKKIVRCDRFGPDADLDRLGHQLRKFHHFECPVCNFKLCKLCKHSPGPLEDPQHIGGHMKADERAAYTQQKRIFSKLYDRFKAIPHQEVTQFFEGTGQFSPELMQVDPQPPTSTVPEDTDSSEASPNDIQRNPYQMASLSSSDEFDQDPEILQEKISANLRRTMQTLRNRYPAETPFKITSKIDSHQPSHLL